MSPAPTPDELAPGLDERRTASLVVRGTAVSFFATALQMGVGFLTTPFFIRELGVEAYGVYTLVLVFTVSGYFGNVDLGLQAAIVRRAAPYATSGRWDALSGVAASAGLMLAAITLTVAAVFAACANVLAFEVFNVPGDLQHTLLVSFYVAAAVLALLSPTFVCVPVLQTVHRWDVAVIVRAAFSLAGIVLAVVLVARTADVLCLILPVVLAPLGAMVGLVVATRRIVPRFAPWPRRATRAEMGALRRFAAVSFVAQAGLVVASNLDQLLIGAFVSARMLGIYGIAAVVYSAVFAAYWISTSTVYAAAAAMHARGDAERLRGLLVRGTRYAGSIVLVAAVAAALYGPPFIDAWVGPEFHEAGVLLVVWLTHFAVTAFAGVSQSALPAIGRVSTAAWISLAAVGVNLVASLALMVPFGAVGIVAGTAIGFAATAPLFVAAAASATGTRRRALLRRAVAPAYAAALAAAVVGGAVRLALDPAGLAPVIAAGAVTAAAGIATAAALLPRDERNALRATLRRRMTGASEG